MLAEADTVADASRIRFPTIALEFSVTTSDPDCLTRVAAAALVEDAKTAELDSLAYPPAAVTEAAQAVEAAASTMRIPSDEKGDWLNAVMPNMALFYSSFLNYQCASLYLPKNLSVVAVSRV